MGRRLRIAIMGCGDVAHRRYIPALATRPDAVEIVACVDASAQAAERTAAAVRPWSPAAKAYPDMQSAFAGADPEALFNLTPAPAHASVSQAGLDAGVHVYSEKPIAASIAEADRLIETATARDLLLLCAPAVGVTRRFRWLREVVSSGRLGRLTLAVGQHADPGPAAWREYTGDPTPFYREGVGPVFDHGIYRLHEMTFLMGAVRRVQAMGAVSSPRRLVRGGPLAGQAIDVTTPDHVLLNLEFVSGTLGQLLASFGTPETRAPWLELHFTSGTISFPGKAWDDVGASIYTDDDSPLGLEGWADSVYPPPPADPMPMVELGALHFMACLHGEERPVLTAQHARHVLDVILAAYASIADGQSHLTRTTL